MGKAKPVAELPEVAPASAGVIPTSQVVILKEKDLDCDLATAIERIRGREETSRSRILVIAPDAEEGQSEGPKAVPRAPMTVGQIARRSEGHALRRLGDRLEPLLGCLQRFFDEARSAIEELADAVPDAGRAMLVEKTRVIEEILTWSGAVAEDLSQEAEAARQGRRPLDTQTLVQEMAGQVEALYPKLRVTVGVAVGPTTCWGRASELAEAFFLAMVLTGRRIGGSGAITIEITPREGWLAHRIFGHGIPRQVREPEATQRLRELLVSGHGGRIQPDELGPAGTGMTLLLPLRR